MGQMGVPLAVFSLLYTLVGLIFSFWPPIAHVSVKTSNWSLVVYLGTMLLAISWWFFRVRHLPTP